jgi:hypothetical protein
MNGPKTGPRITLGLRELICGTEDGNSSVQGYKRFHYIRRRHSEVNLPHRHRVHVFYADMSRDSMTGVSAPPAGRQDRSARKPLTVGGRLFSWQQPGERIPINRLDLLATQGLIGDFTKAVLRRKVPKTPARFCVMIARGRGVVPDTPGARQIPRVA